VYFGSIIPDYQGCVLTCIGDEGCKYEKEVYIGKVNKYHFGQERTHQQYRTG
jgi:hypothetical protein